MSTTRINALRRKIKAENLDGMIITHLDYIRYLTGFTGSSGLLLISPKGADFFTDFRYDDQSHKQVKGARVNIIKGDPLDGLKDQVKLAGTNYRYGIDGDHVSVAQYNKLGTCGRRCCSRAPRSCWPIWAG